MRSLLKSLAIYVIIGPLIGLFALLISMQIQAHFAIEHTKTDIYLIPMAYVFGFLPALGTGVLTYLLRKRVAPIAFAIISGVIGATLSSVLWLIEPTPLATILQLGALPGFAAGFGSAILARRFLSWPPNNSFKPRPLRGSA